jgi:outer membrane protein assembly factor BamE (lipoprotein component of BamABCDE complex)
MKRWRLVMVLVALSAVLAGGPHVALAQEGDPDATPTGDFVTPDPSACQIEPRSLDSVVTLLGTPVAGSPAPAGMDEGEPANADVVTAVTALAQESVACFNAGNFLAQFAFYTDDALLALIPPGLTADDLAGFLGAPPEPLPAEARESVLVRDVMVLPDGRVTAYVVLRNPEGIFTTFVTFQEQRDGYVITSDIDVEAELATPAA